MGFLDTFTSLSLALGGPFRVPGALEPGLPLALAHDRPEVSNPHQVVGSRGEGKHPPHPSQSTVARLVHQPHGLDPAKISSTRLRLR